MGGSELKKESRLLAECTAREVQDFLRTGFKVIVPAGATEQHGPHAPMGTDTILATEVSVRIAKRIGALVAPGFPYGLSGDHLGFPVAYLSVKTLTGLVQDVCISLAETGFREIIFVNGHYTNIIGMAAAIAEVGDRLPNGAFAFPFNYWDALPAEQLEQYLSAAAGLHANIGETSAVMAVDESLVDMERAVDEYPRFAKPPSAAQVAAFFFSGKGTTYRATRSGVWGDPRQSSAERGRIYLKQIEEAGVRFIEEVEEMFRTFPSRSELPGAKA
ncbi:MAG: creatininase family protein [Chloroflexi bacterium]|nr:MAG: creatininase family protein [Chloroflexota bacterium]TMC72329.1 MAG: creatininase family protein [Chloroflexota bacterium]